MKNSSEKIRSAIKEQREKLDLLINNPSENKILSVKINMDTEQATMFEFIKILTRENDENILASYLFYNGLLNKFNDLKKMRDYIYGMGNLELLADKAKIGLSEEEKEIAAAKIDLPKKPVDEYWDMGYISVECPFCGHERAVWHPENKKFVCINGCHKQTKFEKKPMKNENN